MAYWVNVTILLTHGITASICCIMFFLELKISSDVVLLQHIKSIMQWLISVHGDKLGVNCFLGRKLKINVELCNKNYAAKYVPMFAYVLHKFWPFVHFMTTEIASVFGGLSFILFVSVCVCLWLCMPQKVLCILLHRFYWAEGQEEAERKDGEEVWTRMHVPVQFILSAYRYETKPQCHLFIGI